VRLAIGVQFQAEFGFVLISPHLHRLWNPPDLLFIVYLGVYTLPLEGPKCDISYEHSSGAEVNNL